MQAMRIMINHGPSVQIIPINKMNIPIQIEIRNLQIIKENILAELKSEEYSNLSDNETELTILCMDIGDSFYRAKLLQKIKLLGDLRDIEATLESYAAIIRRKYKIFTESESDALGTQQDGAITEEVRNENFTDVVGEDLESISTGYNITTKNGSAILTDMGDFLSRPVELYNGAFAVGTVPSLRLQVWRLFTDQPSIRAKIRNFPFLRANLKIRIVISGTPFHYGAILVSYQPYANLNNNIINYMNNLTFQPTMRPCFLNYLSQAEGSVIMDIQQNAPIDIECPFISTKPMHRLYNVSTSVITTSFTDMIDAGDLFIYGINPVSAASASPTDIYINIYGWMENVELGTNTATQIQVVTESESDERRVGPVEKIATRVNQVSSALVNIPWLGPFATATSIASGALKSVAALFGWSKATQDDHGSLVVTEPVTNTALCISTSTARKIALDQHQETSVDGTPVGINEDQMIIQNISKRRTYWGTITWTSEDAVMGASLWNTKVHPNLLTIHNSTWATCQPTAMAFAVQPFQFWRGDIVFRLEIKASAFHRGKLAIFYEPNCNQFTLINAGLSINKQFIKVIDIQETRTIDVKVNWASHRPWLKNMEAQYAQNNTILTTPTNYGEGYANGYLGIVPFTELQSPDGSDIYINIYVQCDNLRVAVPTWGHMPGARKVYTESESSSITQVEVSNTDINLSTASAGNISQEFFGEEVFSYRVLMKRYATTYTNVNPTITAGQKFFFQHRIFPISNLPFGATTITDSQYEFFTYLRYAYLGYKGSIRKLVRHNIGYLVDNFQRYDRFAVGVPNAVNVDTAGVSAAIALEPLLVNGSYALVPTYNPSSEVELPFYSNNLFCYSFNDTNDDTLGQESMERTWVRNYDYTCGPLAAFTSGVKRWSIDSAIGEDFTFLRYQGAPFYTATPIA